MSSLAGKGLWWGLSRETSPPGPVWGEGGGPETAQGKAASVLCPPSPKPEMESPTRRHLFSSPWTGTWNTKDKWLLAASRGPRLQNSA